MSKPGPRPATLEEIDAEERRAELERERRAREEAERELARLRERERQRETEFERRREREEGEARQRKKREEQTAFRNKPRGPKQDEDYSFLDGPKEQLVRQPEESETQFQRRRRVAVDAELGRDVIRPVVRLWRIARALVTIVTVFYCVALIAMLAAIEFDAENSVFTAALAYLPPYGFIVPGIILMLLCAITRPLMCLAPLICGVYLFWYWMGWRSNEPRLTGAPSVVLISNNVGQSTGQNLDPLAQAEQPDFIALQDAMLRGEMYAKRFPNFNVAEQDEFVLLSKHPIVAKGRVPVFNGKEPIAAWFAVDWKGTMLIIYNVHLPTPRKQIDALNGVGWLSVLLGKPGGHGSQVKTESEAFWKAQKGMAEDLSAALLSDRRPFIVAGDFNAPDHGVIYRRFAAHLKDSFARTGSGYGFTFPGDTRLFPTWLRIDYVWGGPHFDPVYAAVGAAKRQQHFAVVAKLELRGAKPAVAPGTPRTP